LAQSLLRTPGFAIYLVCRFLLGLILRAQVLAVGYHIYELTNDPIAIGYVGLAMFLPVVGFGLVAGDIADRVNRAVLLSISSFFGAASSIGLLAITISDTAAVWPFYALITLFGTALAFSRPAAPSLVPQLVGSAQLSNAIAMSNGTSQMATIVGPAVAGALLIFGPATVYSTTALISVIAGAFWLLLKPYAENREPAQREQSMLARISDGIRIVLHRPQILGAMSLDLFAVLLGSVVALLPVFARDILMVGPFELGLLRAAPAVGAATMAVFLARMVAPRPAGAMMFGGVAVFGVAVLVFGLSRSLPLSLLALCVSGAADMMSNVLRNTTIQLSTPNAIRGRVNSVNQVFISGANELGDFRAGVSAGLLGTVPAVMIGGVGTITIALLWAWLFPSLRKLDRLSDLRAGA
jgi:MFS family permease